MLFGHNSDVAIGGTVFHVQTEDRGVTHALIDTMVYCRGHVMHRRTTKYSDLLPLTADSAQALKLRIDDQHRTVLEELRTGVLQLAPPITPTPPATVKPPVVAAPVAPPQPRAISLELMNPRTWLAGKHATLQVAVRHKDDGAAVAGAQIHARVDGAAEQTEFTAETRPNGQGLLEFDMPRLTGEEPALVIEASSGEVRTQLRFQLRAKPKVPTTG